jgi:hypothetical protein
MSARHGCTPPHPLPPPPGGREFSGCAGNSHHASRRAREVSSGRAGILLALAAVLAVMLQACGAAAPQGGVAAPTATPSIVVTEADSGRTVPLPTGDVAALHLSDRYTWTEPEVRGGAVHVSHVRDVPGAGYQQWTVMATGRGTATITSAGRLRCTPGDLCPGAIRAFSVTIVVT